MVHPPLIVAVKYCGSQVGSVWQSDDPSGQSNGRWLTYDDSEAIGTGQVVALRLAIDTVGTDFSDPVAGWTSTLRRLTS